MSDSFLTNNLQAIEHNDNHVISSLDSKIRKYELFHTDSKLAMIHQNGEHFKYNNLKLNYRIDDYKFNQNGLFFISGITDIETIVEMYNRATKGSAFFIFEPNPEVFHYIISNYNLSELFSRDNVYLLVADFVSAPSYFEMFLLKRTLIAKTSQLQFFTSDYLYYFESDNVNKLQKKFIEHIKTALFSLGNSTEDTMLGLLQNLLNLRKFCNAMPVTKLKDAYASLPVIIVSAGPSLEKNIHYLKKIPRENILIFSVDTTLEKLLRVGIIPDAVFSIERISKVYEYFYKDVEIPKETVFVGPLVVQSKILEKFSADRMILPLRTDDMINEWINELVMGKSEDISMGASCAHLAFSFARYIGCDPIILIGQDLAYGNDGLSHSKGTVYDKGDIPKRKLEEFHVQGYNGGKVKTTSIWRHFSNWFEQEFYNTNQQIINATEGGAKLQHCVQMPLKDSLKKYASKPITPLKNFIDLNYEPLINDFDGIEKRIISQVHALNDFSSLMEKFLTEFNNISDKINENNNSFFIKESINSIAEMRKQYEYEINNELAFLHFFTQTHELIAAYEFNKLDSNNADTYVADLIRIIGKLFDISKKISDVIANELEKFLNTSWQ